MQFPVKISFKLLALAPQMYVTDSAGATLGYVKQKLLAFKEAVTVYTDETMSQEIYRIAADRVIDFNAEYFITNAAGQRLGSVQRSGMRSLWKAHYVINVGGQPAFDVNEASALVRVIDGLIGEIPIVGMLSGLFLNPTYNITRFGEAQIPGAATSAAPATGPLPALKMVKHRALLESLFEISSNTNLTPAEQETVMLGLMMIVLLERSRG
jgi:uncharacterized protein YxjI